MLNPTSEDCAGTAPSSPAALALSDDQLAHIAGADAVIDRVVEPVAAIAQKLGHMRFAKAGHAIDQHSFLRGGAPVIRIAI